jgi:FMN-dependent NADH-azoreductase
MGAASISRHLSARFVEHWKQAHPDGKVITRDLTTSNLRPVTAEWVAAAYTPPETRTADQKEALSLSDALLADLQEADEYVIALPMHNFNVSSLIKLWIDQVVRVGVTFKYVGSEPKGLLEGKKATVITAAAGVYGAGTATASLNFAEPYMKTILGFIGVTDVAFHVAGGAAALNYGADRKEFLQPHEEAVAALAAAKTAVR